MKNHTDLLNYLAETFNLQSYLEIGVQNPTNNFDKILCEKYKVGVDPDIKAPRIVQGTSDEFFDVINEGEKWDLIFIDGLHHADQVKRDFENALKCLSDNGFIVMHDTLPDKEEHTRVPRDSKVWNGDVYKFAASLVTYDGIDFITVNFDYGCTIVWKDASQKGMKKKYKAVNNWEDFKKKKSYLNIVELKDVEKYLFEETCLKERMPTAV